MECTVTWTGATGARSGMGFLAETGSGHVLVMDGAPDEARPENGGRNLAPRPMETVLAGTGGCTAYDVVLILKRGRHDVRGGVADGRERRTALGVDLFDDGFVRVVIGDLEHGALLHLPTKRGAAVTAPVVSSEVTRTEVAKWWAILDLNQ